MSTLPHESHEIAGSGYCALGGEGLLDLDDRGRLSVRGGTSGEENDAIESSVGVDGCG